jgi:hypothetical protein
MFRTNFAGAELIVTGLCKYNAHWLALMITTRYMPNSILINTAPPVSAKAE